MVHDEKYCRFVIAAWFEFHGEARGKEQKEEEKKGAIRSVKVSGMQREFQSPY